MQEQTVKETALCGRSDIKEPERASTVIGNICLLRTVIAAGHFFSFFFFLLISFSPPVLKPSSTSNVRQHG